MALNMPAYDSAFVRRVAPRLDGALRRWFRGTVEGFEHLPTGPFVAVGNHGGSVLIPDALRWLSAYAVHGAGPPMLSLAHDSIFDVYPSFLGRTLGRLGAIRASHDVAQRALGEGYALTVYPGGDFDACRPWSKRNTIEFAGRTGYVQLALAAKVPIVPVVSCGGHETLIVLHDGAWLAQRLPWCRRARLKAWPVSISVPWGLWIGPPPGYVPLPARIDVRILAPMEVEGAPDDALGVAAVDRRVRSTMQNTLDALARGRRWPVLG